MMPFLVARIAKEGFFILKMVKKMDAFENIVKKLSPTLRKITYKLNGHFSFFDDDDLFQETLAYLWVAFQKGKLSDKTDSYILQGCYYHLKNYLRKTVDKARLVSLHQLIDDEDAVLENILSVKDSAVLDFLEDKLLVEKARLDDLTEREKDVLDFCLEGMTMREIGQRIGISHVMVIKIKKRLRTKLENFKRVSLP